MVEKITSRKKELDFKERQKDFQKRSMFTQEEPEMQPSESLDEKVLTKGRNQGKGDEHVKPRQRGAAKAKKPSKEISDEKEAGGKGKLTVAQEPDIDQEKVTPKRNVVHRIKEEPHVECIIEKPFIEESHLERVEEFRERAVYEVHETVNDEIIYEESQHEHYILPTRYEEIDKEKQQLAKQELDYVRAVKKPERIRENTEVRRVQEKPVVTARHEEERVEIHERPIVREIHKLPTYKFFEHPVVRTVYEQPVLRIRRDDSKFSETDVQEHRQHYGEESFAQEELASQETQTKGMVSFSLEKESSLFEKELGNVGRAWYSSYLDALRYVAFLATTWIMLWIAAPIGIHLASQFQLFGLPIYRSINSNRRLLLLTTALCFLGYIPGMVFALGYFAAGLLSEMIGSTSPLRRLLSSSSSSSK